jgi:HEPN domain-containing protein
MVQREATGRLELGPGMAQRAADWLKQAERDLALAEQARATGWHEWACFAAHQAADKAAKALYQHLGRLGWGHVVARLLQELPEELRPPPELIEEAHELDTYYIPTRYPDSHAAGAPFEHYSARQSERAVNYARAIITFVRHHLAEPSDGR